RGAYSARLTVERASSCSPRSMAACFRAVFCGSAVNKRDYRNLRFDRLLVAFWSGLRDTHKIPHWANPVRLCDRDWRRVVCYRMGSLASGVSGAIGDAVVQGVLVSVLLPVASVRVVVCL